MMAAIVGVAGAAAYVCAVEAFAGGDCGGNGGWVKLAAGVGMAEGAACFVQCIHGLGCVNHMAGGATTYCYSVVVICGRVSMFG